jgi:GT2 family glycosyltransferase
MNQDKIGIIIPTLNLYDRYTKPLIQALLKAETTVPIEIIIVDNGSTDGTADKVLADFPTVNLHKNETNTGCACAWNAGILMAQVLDCNYFAILNSDILLCTNTIQNLYNRLKQGDKLLVAGLDIAGECMIPEAVLDPTAGINRKDYSEAPHPHFSCFMINENTLDKVGWFNEIFYPAYFEDNDYHHRIKIMGGNDAGITITTACFYHFGSKTQNEALGIGTPVVRGDVFKENEKRFVNIWGNIPSIANLQNPYADVGLSAKLNKDQTWEPTK